VAKPSQYEDETVHRHEPVGFMRNLLHGRDNGQKSSFAPPLYPVGHPIALMHAIDRL